MFTDFQKAFDSIDHDFMFNCLYHMGFSHSIIKWVKLFYKDPKSCITNNGYMSDFFQIKRGVRQGCPLSPYLFLICIEFLSREISRNENIKGIKINNIEIKQTLFADDASFLVDNDKRSFETLVRTLEKFGNISGLKLNINKCTILKIGNIKNKDIRYCTNKKIHMDINFC